MSTYILLLLVCVHCIILLANTSNLNYIDPIKLQTKTSPAVQQHAAYQIISKYVYNTVYNVSVEVDPNLFTSKKDTFVLHAKGGRINIRASTGVAAVWAFHHYLKKYCKCHVGWQVKRLELPQSPPDADDIVVANDRFRYYQNVCTASYSFVWWKDYQWADHLDWMAFNGINLALAPTAQEASWSRVYKRLGLTDDEIDEHFTGPAFLSWLRMGNVRGWAGPLYDSWHYHQTNNQQFALDYMLRLGMVPVLPAFNGHVPKALSRIYPNTTFHKVGVWNGFKDDYCCGSFLEPTDPLFKNIGKMFLKEISSYGTNHIYTADPFNEVKIEQWSTVLVQNTAVAIFSTLLESDENAVWLLQNWMFVHDPILWPKTRVRSFLTSVPSGRIVILDLQSEQWPQYDLYEMYFGQPFIWCMLHNFGGTLGMFGNMKAITQSVHETRIRTNSTMIGVGLTPEGINQNYVVYDLMLESAWRKTPVQNLDEWSAEYARRRYGCNSLGDAWRYLLKSVYSFDGLNKMRGKYVITRRPSFRIKPWAWYKSRHLFEAFKLFALDTCNTTQFHHDLVDVTRQALQYRAEQLYFNILKNRFSTTYNFNASINQFLDAMYDIRSILETNPDFSASEWLYNAKALGAGLMDKVSYEFNAKNQITLWGPNGEITDYACKQWAEIFTYYYIPRWKAFLSAALDAKMKDEFFDERRTQDIVRSTVEEQLQFVKFDSPNWNNPKELALYLYKKWALVPGLEDLPLSIIRPDPQRATTLADTDSVENETPDGPTVVLLGTTTPR